MPNIIDFYYLDKHLNGLKFSMCVSNTEGGFMSFGDQNTEKHLSGEKTHTVPISRRSGQYNINVYSLKVIIFFFTFKFYCLFFFIITV